VEVQTKDGAPVPAFALRWETDGPAHDPTLVRLHADDLGKASAAEELKEKVFEATSRLPAEEALTGQGGVSIKALAADVKRSNKPVRDAVALLVAEERLRETGTARKGRKLYGVIMPDERSKSG
jgi:hypothetical protein